MLRAVVKKINFARNIQFHRQLHIDSNSDRKINVILPVCITLIAYGYFKIKSREKRNISMMEHNIKIKESHELKKKEEFEYIVKQDYIENLKNRLKSKKTDKNYNCEYDCNGEKHGKEIWLGDNGNVIMESNYCNGMKNGAETIFHPNGKKFVKVLYIDGKRHFYQQFFDDNENQIYPLHYWTQHGSYLSVTGFVFVDRKIFEEICDIPNIRHNLQNTTQQSQYINYINLSKN